MSKTTKKPTYREAAKDLKKLKARSKVGHQTTLTMAILALEEKARAEEAKAKVCKCSCEKKN